ncbi:MAG TPA: PKD domain-containing protein [Ktedonobacterales bacterium]|nr:PKD domain-containing protein [Ktedonobacterales bacterium]
MLMYEQYKLAGRRIAARIISTMLILSIALLLALTLAVGTPPLLGQTSLAQACGLANTPTMMANNDPAIPTPVTPTSDPNQPVGFFPGDYASNQQITFTEDLSAVINAPPKESLQWRWNFGDGSAPASGSTPQHTYQSAGTYNVHTSIYDTVTSSWVDFDSATITLLARPWDSPPIAKASASKTLVTFGDVVTFDATGSKAQVGSIVSYTWNFGDTQEGEGPHITHSFSVPGKAQVTLIVKDSRGALSTASVPIQVVESIPQVHLQTSAPTAQVGQDITFDAQVQTQQGDPIAKYIWDFGDQTPQQTTTSGQVSHHYAKTGRYQVQVQAIDSQNVPGTATINITVQTQGTSTSTNSSNSNRSFLIIGLGILILLVIGVVLLTSLRRRRPIPAIQVRPFSGRRAAPTRAGAGRVVDAGPRYQPRQSPTKRTQNSRPGENSARPAPKPPTRSNTAPKTGGNTSSGDDFLRD